MRPGELVRRGDRPLPLRGRDDRRPTAEADERNERPQDDGSEPFEATVADATSRTSDAQAETEDPSPMPRWGSLSCSDLWSEAYERIKADPDHTELLVRFEGYIATAQDDSSQHDIGHAESPMQLAQIQERAKKSLEKLSNARVSFSIAGRTIVVREVVRKVIKAVTTFKDVISAAISGEPHAALAWAGVMVIIPFLESTLQQDEDAANGLQNIVYLLLRYRQLQEQVLVPEFQDPSQSESARQLLMDIRSKVIDVYVHVYLYEMRLVLQCMKSKARRIVRNAVGADGWKGMWEDIESVSKQIDDGIQSRLNVRILEIWQKMNDSMKQAGDIEDLQQATLACVQDGNQTSLLAQLPCAVNAMFDSAEMGAEESCLRGTQLGILNDIQDWLEDPAGEVIFWLHGMAGTGKTSISLTAAHALHNRQPLAEGREQARDAFLGATFFFKQGDATRNSTKTFFSTIARRLAQEFPDLREHITDAVKNNLEIGSKGPQQQLQDLIIRPLLMLNEDIFMQIQLVIAIDALDECVEEKEVDDLVNMMAALENLRHVRLRILITSRPDNHIFRSFAKLPLSLYRSTVLEKIRPPVQQNDEMDDITRYLIHALAKIAIERDVSPKALAEDDIARLRDKSDGLFIYAATACRFLDTDDFEDEEARREILDQIFDDEMEDDAPQQKVDEIYLKVLSFRRLTSSSKKFIEQILGFIAVFFEPVSVSSLAELLSRDRKKLEERLRQLHSVIHIPKEETAPLSLVHLSLRDFLLSEERSRRLPFRVEEISMHRAVFDRCMEVMSEKLHQDMCDLVLPGKLAAEAAPGLIEKNIPQYLQYACRYWVDHLAKLNTGQKEEFELEDKGKVYGFLAKKLLFWLEAMSLMQETPTVILILKRVEDLISSATSPVLASLVYDAKRFVLRYRWIIERAPLQIYCSALVFSPMRSKVRSLFEDLIPRWIVKKPKVEENWSPELSILEGHTELVTSANFSPSNGLLASVSSDKTVRIWDSTTGVEMYRHSGLKTEPSCVAFSADSKSVAYGTEDGTVEVWEFATGKVIRLLGHSASIRNVVFSPQKLTTLASISVDGALRLWNIEERREIHIHRLVVDKTYRGGTITHTTVAFSPNGQLLAAASLADVRLWEVQSGDHVGPWGLDSSELPLWGYWGLSSGFTNDEMLLVGSCDGTILSWNLTTGERLDRRLYDEYDSTADLAFCFSNGYVAVKGGDSEIGIGHLETLDLITTFSGCDAANEISFSPDGTLLAFPSDSGNYIGLLDLTSQGDKREHPVQLLNKYGIVRFLPANDDFLAFTTERNEVEIWSAASGTSLTTAALGAVYKLFASPDERFLILMMQDFTFQIWDKSLSRELASFEGSYLDISPDSKQIAMLMSNSLRIVDCTSFKETATLDVQINLLKLSALKFSPNSKVGWMNSEHNVFHLWDMTTNRISRASIHSPQMYSCVGFSPDGELVVLKATGLRMFLLLDAVTGTEQMAIGREDEEVCFKFHPLGQLIASIRKALGEHCVISLWDRATESERVLLNSHETEAWDHCSWNLAISTGKLVAGFCVDKKWSIRIWDLTDNSMIGSFSIDSDLGSFRFSPDFRYLDSGSGRIPLLTTGASEEELVAIQDCLYARTQWIVQGTDNLIWLPPAYRLGWRNRDVKDGTIGFRFEDGRVVFIRLDLSKTPLAGRIQGTLRTV